MRKILVIHPSLGLGGAEKIIAFLVNGLSTTYETNILLLKDIPQTLELEESINVIVRDCYYAKPIIGKHIFQGIRGFHNMTIQIENIIENLKPDLVIAFELRTALSLGVIKKKIGIKVLFSERADPYEHSAIWAYMLKKAYKSFDFIVFQTEGAKAYYGSIVSDKSAIVPNPAIQRLNMNKSSCTDTDITKRDKYIFSAGRFQKRKGFDLLIRAFAKIHTRYPEYKLRIYGEGKEREKYESIIKEAGLVDSISLLPRLNGVVEHNKNAMLFVLPSRSEGMPNILMEAMALGIPSVACDCSPGGARIISDNGRYCRLAQNDNVDSLAEELEDALSNLSLTSDMAKDAVIGMKRFDSEVIIDAWKDIIRKILKR